MHTNRRTIFPGMIWQWCNYNLGLCLCKSAKTGEMKQISSKPRGKTFCSEFEMLHFAFRFVKSPSWFRDAEISCFRTKSEYFFFFFEKQKQQKIVWNLHCWTLVFLPFVGISIAAIMIGFMYRLPYTSRYTFASN